MSKFNLLSAAVVAAVAAVAAPAAQAYTVSAGAPNVAYVDITDANTLVSTTGLNVTLTGDDYIIGRTVGFSVKITLKDGAKFGAAVNPAALTAAGVGAAINAGVTTGTAGSSVWGVSVAAGGGIDDTYVILLFSPNVTTPAPITTGKIFNNGLSVQLKGVAAALATAGSSVKAEVMFADPGTAAPIMSPSIEATVLTSVDPLDFKITGGETTKKIDVGTNAGASKIVFAGNGDINGTPATQYFNAGVLAVGVQGAPVNPQTVGGSAFTWVNTGTQDKVTLTVTGDSFAAFKTVTPANGAAVILTKTGANLGCNDATPTALATGVVTNNSVTFSNVDFATANGAELCFVAPASASKVVIDSTKVAVAAKVARTATTKSTNGSAAGKPLLYNGPVVDVDAFNPGSNASQVSYLRITNPSGAVGNVTIDRYCDDGSKGTTSLSVGAGKTVALLASELENGGANVATGYGTCPAGQKARLTVTGEFLGMKVQNFLRNTSTIINTNVNNNN
ncbi:hypothetical protein [Stenotrophomonas sp. PS02297]|uniref:hypothetical protein n=1 Tax=Stenotrophomonas sp. PS02297 TaxID=2991423 RepID=UPI00249C6096|nr:hypothetical protein [Stenotrophomonas sp. PS02297]